MQGDYQSAQFFLDIASFIFDRWEFLVGILIGGSAIHISNKIRIKKKNQAKLNQKGDGNQGTEVVDSPSSPPQTGGRDAQRQEGQNGVLASIHDSPGASIILNGEQKVGSSSEALGNPSTPPVNTPTSLNANQSHIFQKVQEILQKLNINTTFTARYQKAISHLNNNNAQVCASEYHSAFLNVVPTFLERSTYGTNAPTDENLTALRSTFEEIRSFMNATSHDDSTLRTVIRNFENAIMIILGYL